MITRLGCFFSLARLKVIVFNSSKFLRESSCLVSSAKSAGFKVELKLDKPSNLESWMSAFMFIDCLYRFLVFFELEPGTARFVGDLILPKSTDWLREAILAAFLGWFWNLGSESYAAFSGPLIFKMASYFSGCC